MEHYFPRHKITITTIMAIENLPASNDNKVNASPGNSNKTFGHSNLSAFKQNTPQNYVKLGVSVF